MALTFPMARWAIANGLIEQPRPEPTDSGLTAIPLKDLEIRALKPQDRNYKRTDERGLFIEVHPSGSTLWRFKFTHLGKEKKIALGRYPEVPLADLPARPVASIFEHAGERTWRTADGRELLITEKTGAVLSCA